jgi:hypothetical protein
MTTITAVKSFIVQVGFYYQVDSIIAPNLPYLGYLKTYFFSLNPTFLIC